MEAVVHINQVFSVPSVGPIPAGPVVSGTLKPGMSLTVGGTTMTVKSLQIDHNSVNEATAGQDVGIGFENADAALLNGVKGTDVTFTDAPVAQPAPAVAPAPALKPAAAAKPKPKPIAAKPETAKAKSAKSSTRRKAAKAKA